MNISGKTAIVTGGTSGLGEATVYLLHKLGANVVFCARGEARGLEMEAELGPSVKFTTCNVANEEDCQKVIDLALDNAAGVMQNMQECRMFAMKIRKKMLRSLGQMQNRLKVRHLGRSFLDGSVLFSKQLQITDILRGERFFTHHVPPPHDQHNRQTSEFKYVYYFSIPRNHRF